MKTGIFILTLIEVNHTKKRKLLDNFNGFRILTFAKSLQQLKQFLKCKTGFYLKLTKLVKKFVQC